VRSALFVVACVFAASANAAAPPQSVELAGRAVTVWLPTESTRAPVLIFSHGFHGCATQSVFLMEAFADAGSGWSGTRSAATRCSD